MNEIRISRISRTLLIITAFLLVASIFIPIWRIELDAPQYPEGLALLIYSNKIGGDVDIINGLNHYIGMQTLHAENFIEFTILPFIISGFALFTMVTSILGRKKVLYVLLFSFITFGVIAMADFWRWEYNYGHNLDPKAAIIVPGMAYQPPLIGFKQLLNFGAYSIPDIGGWFFIGSGFLMLVTTMIESRILDRFKSHKNSIKNIMLLPILSMFISCTTTQPQPLKLNTDNCDFCKMTISDGNFGCELITDKGRVYKFDDLSCLIRYKLANTNTKFSFVYVNAYGANNILIDAEKAFYIKSTDLSSPMGGNIAAYKDPTEAKLYASKFHTTMLLWKDLIK